MNVSPEAGSLGLINEDRKHADVGKEEEVMHPTT